MTDITEVDGIIGRFISASDEARNRFIDELLAENDRLTAALDFMEKRAVRKEAEIEELRNALKRHTT